MKISKHKLNHLLEYLTYGLLATALILQLLFDISIIWFAIIAGAAIFLSILRKKFISEGDVPADVKQSLKKAQNIIFSIPVSVVLILVVGSLGVRVVPIWFSGISSYAWQSVEGTIVEKSFNIKRTKNEGKLYRPIVTYEYLVDGKKYSNNNLSYSLFIFGENWAKNEMKDYNEYDTVKVYYSKSNPEKSCLKTGPDKWGTIFSLIIFILIIFTAFQLLQSIKQLRRTDQPS